MLTLFSWLNFEYSRSSYESNASGTHRGGVRHGFPMTAWDGGDEAHAQVIDKALSLKTHSFGGWQWGGLVVDLVVFAAAILAAGFVCESIASRGKPVSPGPPRSLSLHPAVYPVVIFSAAALLWANLNVRTELVEMRDGTHDFYQEMGWPFRVYLASNPHFRPIQPPETVPTKEDRLIYLQSNPDSWYQRAHWYMGHIVLNIVLGLACVLALGGAAQFLLRRTRKIAPADVVLPPTSD